MRLDSRQKEYLNDPVFREKYFRLLNIRLVYTNNLIEQDNDPVGEIFSDAEKVDVLDDNYEAFELLLNKLDDENGKLTIDLIKEVADTLNRSVGYGTGNYRKDKEGNTVAFEGKYPIEKTYNIEEKMNELLDNYYGEWQKLGLYEREALFNIEFLRIHPFIDGNGRTSRLILNYNMLRQGHAPILIPEGIREEYFHARNIEDSKWIRRLFKVLSEKEYAALNKIIDSYEIKNTIRKR